MNQVKQTVIGSHNIQETKVFIRPYDPVEICSTTISQILRKVAHIDFLAASSSRLRPPDISTKNKLNDIDAANSVQIERTYALWDEITASIRSDATGETAKDYAKAAYILNQLYLAKFQKDFPNFKLHAIGVYCESTGAGADEAHVLIHLVHYMYLSCQIGITP